MASELRVNTLKDASGNNSVATSVVFAGSAKAWVVCDQRTSLSTGDSYNIASTSDESAGELQHNFTSNMGSAEYSIAGACGYEDTNDDDQVFTLGLRRNNAPAAGNYTIQTCNALATSDGGIDLDNVMTQVCGDLA
tara:strand:+ start:253 stop:660 length:408 start_codon:yes stop_codon:yes gene_type:complete